LNKSSSFLEKKKQKRTPLLSYGMAKSPPEQKPDFNYYMANTHSKNLLKLLRQHCIKNQS